MSPLIRVGSGCSCSKCGLWDSTAPRVADGVHISQSGVSAQIRQLEDEFGADLIDRSGRGGTLTTAGAAALEHARAALSAVTSVRQAVDDVAGLVRGRLVIGMVTACTVTPFFDALAAFHRAHPGVEIAPPLAEPAGFPVVCLPEGTGVRTVPDPACASNGLSPDIALQCSAPDAVVDLAAQGLGVAVLSASMATGYRDRLTAVPIVGVDIPAVLSLVWTKPESTALCELLAHCRRAAGLRA